MLWRGSQYEYELGNFYGRESDFYCNKASNPTH